MESLFAQVNEVQDMLSKASIHDLIQLPEIIVVGEQSAGKSSVLQSIIEKEILPKGRGIVTRCPIRIRMNYSQDSRGDYATFTHLPDQFFKFNDIDEEIRRQSSILTSEQYISKEEITVNLYSSRMANLTLVDMPGVVSIRTEGQPENIVSMIENMVRKRIENSNVLILAITPAVSDLANSKALSMAQSADPEGKRTIGVFTKLDRLENGCSAIELIEGTKFPLALGYVGVICRSQQEIEEGKTLEDQFVKEIDFYDSNEQYRERQAYFGISTLKAKLEVEFKNHLISTFPKIHAEVNKKLEHTSNELIKLGRCIPEGYSLLSYAHECLTEIFKQIDGLMDGSLSSPDSNKLIGGAVFRNSIQVFHTNMRRSAGIFKIDEKALGNAFLNCGGLEGIVSMPVGLQKRLIKENIMNLRKVIHELVAETHKKYEDFVRCVEKQQILTQYQKFKNLVFRTFNNIINKNNAKLLKKIEFLLNLEADQIDPDHEDFSESAFNKEKEEEEAKEKERGKDKEKEKEKAIKDPKQITMHETSEARNVTELRKLVQKYFIIGKRSLDEQVPKYLKHYFIRKNISDLKSDLKSSINKATSAEVTSLFDETSDVQRKRVLFANNKTVLEEASIFLQQVRIEF